MITLSASQISTALSCLQKWAFDKIDNVPRPTNDSAALGTATHSELEAWFVDGEVPHSVLATAMLATLPERGETLESEAAVEFLWPQVGAKVKGFIDLRDLSLPVPLVIDFKTTSQITRAKAPADLDTDPQALFYGLATRLDVHAKTGVFPEEVDLWWRYGETRVPKTKLPRTHDAKRRQTLKILEEGLTDLEPIARNLVALRDSGQPASSVPGNLEACYQYGRCPYADRCPTFNNRLPKPKVTVALDSALLAALAAASNAASAPAPASGPTPEPTLKPFDSSGIRPVSVQVSPPDAAPDVSPTDPPPPPLKAPKASKKKSKVDPILDFAPGAARSFEIDTEPSAFASEPDDAASATLPVQDVAPEPTDPTIQSLEDCLTELDSMVIRLVLAGHRGPAATVLSCARNLHCELLTIEG